MSIQVKGVSKRFGDFRALKSVDLEVKTGELVALLGPSGSGKTTLLRIIAGLEMPDEGEVHFHGVDATTRDVRGRQVGFVFQHYALFRHMTVFENVAFGLRVRPARSRPSRKEIEARVHELLQLVQLDGLAQRYPSQLSGGQRQRVALARALAVEPQVLLLDEPFGALDARVRQQLRRWLRRLHDDLHITSVFVTHDQEEALEVADRVVVMHEGRIEQQGTPEAVYEHPATPFVFNFLGNVNVFRGRVNAGQALLGPLQAPAPEHGTAINRAASGYVRPHDLEVARYPNGGGEIPVAVRHISAVGPVVRLELEHSETGELVEAELTRDRYGELEIKAGDRVYIRPRKLRIFVDDDYAISGRGAHDVQAH